jgi:flagellin-like protein
MMKKTWKIRKNSEAVSPVIATILMVAITVVLAAVLYVMVMGFTPGGGSTPQGAFTTAEKTSATTYKVSFGAISPDTKFIDCKIRLDGVGAQLAGQVWTIGAAPTFTTTASPASTATITITDIGADGKISVGDYLTIGVLSSAQNGDLLITLIYTSTGGSICTKTFTVAL